MNNYTEEDLLRFIYDEVSETEKTSIQKQIEVDAVFREKFLNMMKVIKEMDAFSAEPSQSTIDIIIEESHHNTMETSS